MNLYENIINRSEKVSIIGLENRITGVRLPPI
ncbi:hypothetical protein J2Z83_001290 [Virgibacillus natechei]|uniref:Uncharacterized protein n=1 Tax=Virgibacillus natechei TaxID=1216297 RepID=A0ABS4IFR3_9BACI|nr:hypothetical protein [Virgibacillus natechei]